MDDVTGLVTAPFHDLVQKSRIALQNAGSLQPMAQAASSLLKEGQRAITRLEPMCQRYWEDHGIFFVGLLKENDELAKYRKLMIGLLWEFDDYIHPEDFDVEKFAELQALSRDLAPRIYDILLTFKFDSSSRLGSQMAPEPSPPLSPYSTSAVGFSPVVPQVGPARGASRLARDSASSGWTSNSSGSVIRSPAADDLGPMLSKVDSFPPIPSSSSPPLPMPRKLSQGHVAFEGEVFRAPSAIPWDNDPGPKRDDAAYQDAKSMQEAKQLQEARQFQESKQFLEARQTTDPTQLARRPRPKPPMERSANLNLAPTMGPSPYPRRNVSLPRPPGHAYGDNRRSGVVLGPIPGEGEEPPHSAGPESAISVDGGLQKIALPRPPKPTKSIPPIPGEDAPMRKQVSRDQFQGIGIPNDAVQPPTARGRSPSVTESLVDPDPLPICTSPVAPFNDRISALFPDVILHGFPSPPALKPFDTPIDSMISEERPEAEEAKEEEEEEEPPSWMAMSEAKCIIDEESSFRLYKGFCPGATEVQGGAGTVARCKHCMYEFDFKQLELDLNKTKEGCLTKHDVGYRQRFLQKSHMPPRKVDDVTYACVFCIHMGRTPDPGDATVFTTVSALLLHISRHSRPLPQVEGVVAVEAADITPDQRNNYDLCFFKPPARHPARESAAEIANLPSAVAKEGLGRMATQKLPPPDRAPMLELVQGARVTGIMWPDEYDGEWCLGWHEGVRAAVPSDILRLDRPDWDEMGRSGSRSAIKGKAKWKFSPKENKKDWLRFEEDELITNITWTRFEHWCWSGTNAKGKWGVFPSAFLDLNTLQDLAPGSSGGSGTALSSRSSFDRQSIIGTGSLKAPSIFGKMKGKFRAASESVASKNNSGADDSFGYFMTR
ncbi:hypothetical protein ESCO_002917 [Escovopsis weberi]|uniref:SH3 domain-containing protein n=1 Tax=Escovopsis weberi TaxID=150374 RepID=A0A0M9VT34_ESCWE|nr:hypothetical protein ESCO_002917 [Escovopsis weberi]